jgi:hypothetical protein
MASTRSDASLWEQATSTSGGRWAVGIAIAAVCAGLAGGGVALAASARADRALVTATAVAPGAAGGDQHGRSGQGSDGNNGAKGTDDSGQEGDLNALPGRLKGLSHGEVTRPSASGGTETLLVQNGAVTASNDTSVTVRSSDGFTETYAVSATTKVRGPAKAGGLAPGTDITVVAAKDGKAALLLATKGKPA